MIHQAILLLLIATAALADDVLALVIEGSSKRTPLLTVAPTYPRKARRDRIEGAVQVCFEVNREGKTKRVSVRNSSHRAFEKPSVRAVKDSTFRPLSEDEALSPSKSCRTFVFSLEPVQQK